MKFFTEITQFKSIAIEFARALDGEDYGRAKELMAEDCVYVLGENELKGSVDIVKSYEASSVRTKSLFDGVTYESEIVEQEGENVFVVEFKDHLRKKGISHCYRSRQTFEVNEHLKISRIVLIEILSENSKLKSFLDQVGVEV